jgi:hypothetical protein
VQSFTRDSSRIFLGTLVMATALWTLLPLVR